MDGSYKDTDRLGFRVASLFGPHLLIHGAKIRRSAQNVQGAVSDVKTHLKISEKIRQRRINPTIPPSTLVTNQLPCPSGTVIPCYLFPVNPSAADLVL